MTRRSYGATPPDPRWFFVAVAAVLVATLAPFLLRAATPSGPMAAVVGVATEYVPIRGEAPHVVIEAATRTPSVMDWDLMTATVAGQLGAGNTTCLTAWWMVDAQGVWKEGERFCGPPFKSFRRQYQFFNAGEYDVFVSLRTLSAREFDQKHVHLVVQPKAED